MGEVVITDRFDMHDVNEVTESSRADGFNHVLIVRGVTKYWSIKHNSRQLHAQGKNPEYIP